MVLSYGLWQRKFGGNPNVIGSSLSLGNEPYTIIGVLGKDFLSDPEADIWLPFQFEPNSTNQGHYFQAAGLLKPGVTLAQANAQMKLAASQYLRAYPMANPQQSFAVEPLRDSIVGDVRKSLLVLLGAVGFVLLIACANVANLLLVRATGRRREFAIRSALGAGRARIIRQLLTESVLLSVTGGVLGLLLGFMGVRALLAVSPAGLPRIGEDGSAIGVDWRVLTFTLAVSLFTGILFGLFPAFSASRSDLNSTLKESSNRSGTGFGQSKARSLLVISEVSLALVLLIGSALLIRTFLALRGVSPGFDAHQRVDHGYVALRRPLSEDGRRRATLARWPGSPQCPSRGRNVGLHLLPAHPGPVRPAVSGRRPSRRTKEQDAPGGWMSVSPGYFSVFKIPILQGRDFTENDTAGAPGVVLINKPWPNSMAQGEPHRPADHHRQRRRTRSSRSLPVRSSA